MTSLHVEYIILCIIRNSLPVYCAVMNAQSSIGVIKAFSSAISGNNYVKTIMSNSDLWGLDLTTLDGAFEFVNECFNAAELKSVKEAMVLLK